MFEIVDCGPSPTIVCELDRIADSLADKAPSSFELAQLWVSLVAAVGTLIVGALAAYIAYRSHQLATRTSKDAGSRRLANARRSFGDRALATVDRIRTAALQGAPNLDMTLRTEIAGLITEATASSDPSDKELAEAIRAFGGRVINWSQDDRAKFVDAETASMKLRVIVWITKPPLRLSAEDWDRLAVSLRPPEGEPATSDSQAD